MSEQEELLKLRALVEQQRQALIMKDKQLEQQTIQIENLTQAILHARKKMFGRSSEVTQTDGQINLFGQEELITALVEEQKELVITEHKRKARQPGVRAEMIAGLPVEVVHCVVDESAACPRCQGPLIKVGEKVIRSEVVYEPATLKVIQYVQEIRKCSRCGKEGSGVPTDVFVGANVPRPVLPHSLSSASLIAGVLYQKYDMGIPLSRQERD